MKRIKQLVADSILWFIWFPLRSFIQKLPVGLVNKIGSAGGLLLYYISASKRQIIKTELTALFRNARPLSGKEMKDITRRGLQMFCKRQMENLYWGRLDREIIDRMVSFEGMEHLDNALKNKRGAILLTSHFGSHLLPPLALGFNGYKVHQIAGPPLLGKQRKVFDKIFRLREKESESLPLKFIVIGSSMRPIFRQLAKNEILFIAFDGTDAKKMVPVDFLNSRASFSSGPFKMSMTTKAPILPIFNIRQDDDTHRVVIGPPFELDRSEDKEKVLAVSTEKYAGIFEKYVSKYPCHYAMTLMRVRELINEGALEVSPFDAVEHKDEVSPDKRSKEAVAGGVR